MSEGSVVVECRNCEFLASYANLGRARVALNKHEVGTGHDVDWQINHVTAGVEQAGADAGICGTTNCENPDSALLDW